MSRSREPPRASLQTLPHRDIVSRAAKEPPGRGGASVSFVGLSPEQLGATAVILEGRGVPALDATLPGEAPHSARRLLEAVPLPVLDLGDACEWRLGELIGEGGMGSVCSALQRSLQRDVAVKRLRETLTEHVGAAWLLIDEARITGALEHPNIVPIHTLGLDADGLPVMVMKRLSGRVWRDIMSEAADSTGRTMPVGGWRELFGANLEILMQVCNAVHFAHSRGIVHRDVKPENVMIGDHGEVYLLDWGAAVRFHEAEISEAIVGTLAYMAPEMLRGSGPGITPQTDVYLLGATLHEILTGRPPHAAADVQAALHSISRSEIEAFPPWVPVELGELCCRALSPRPGERPRSALELKQALADFVIHRGSIELAHAAAKRLQQLQAHCEPAAARQLLGDEVGIAEVNQLFIECAFGYRQALDAWPENMQARAGLQASYEHMIQFELTHRNPGTAAGLLAQLARPREDLRQAIEQLKRDVSQEEAELQRFRSIAKEQDPSAASAARATSAVVTGICLAALFVWLSRRFPGAVGLDHRTITLVTLAIALGLAAGTLVYRDKVLANDINRRLTATMFSIVLTVVAIHAAGMLTGASVSYALMTDFFVSGAVTATVGASIHRSMVIVGATYFIGALVAAFIPQFVLESMAVTFLLAHLALARTWWVLARETASTAV